MKFTMVYVVFQQWYCVELCNNMFKKGFIIILQINHNKEL